MFDEAQAVQQKLPLEDSITKPVFIEPPPPAAAPAPQTTQQKEKAKPKKVKAALSDDEFGSSSSEQEDAKIPGSSPSKLQVPTESQIDLKMVKAQYRKHLPQPEEMRKKNFIGDQIIVEKDPSAEAETARGEKNLDKDPLINKYNQINYDDNTVIAKGAMAKRMQKISKLYDDSTKEFKEQQKEIGIKQAESKILAKAK